MQWIINIIEFLFFEWILSGNVILSPVNESVVLDGWSGKKKNVLATIDYGEDQKGHLRLFIDKFKQQLTEPTDIETTTPPVDEITGNSFAAAAAGKIPSWAAIEYVLLGFLISLSILWILSYSIYLRRWFIFRRRFTDQIPTDVNKRGFEKH